jgi:CDP-glucose 4,6-dehydratase
MEGLAVTSVDPAFWRGKRVLLTGHTGFKGAWCALWLHNMGAEVFGLALAPETDPNLFDLARVGEFVSSRIGDVRDAAFVARTVTDARPEIILHMAAQALVRRSVRTPVATFEANVMGTAHVLEAARSLTTLKAILVVTTDKVYENAENGMAFRETDPLGGHDPYSASKAAAEIVTAAYARTYFNPRNIPVAAARGGNVIGGGDFSEDRIVPDIWRAMRKGEQLTLRNPAATRPWQHVLDCLSGYLSYAQALATRPDVPRALNFGPLASPEAPVSTLAEAMQSALGVKGGWRQAEGPQIREMQALALDCSLAQASLGFRDKLVGEAAIKATSDWYLAQARGQDMGAFTLQAIVDYIST